MADRITVEYSRKETRKVGDDFVTMQLGGAVETDVQDGVGWPDAYEAAYVTYRLKVDTLFDESMPQRVSNATPTAVNNMTQLPGEKIAPKAASNGIAGIVENEDRSFTGCKVFNVEVRKARTGNTWVRVRIGNRDQIPGQYVTAKSFEPLIVQKLKALEEGDFINVEGFFQGWQGNEDRDEPKFDFVVQRVEKNG